MPFAGMTSLLMLVCVGFSGSDQARFFREHVAPILSKHCVTCHRGATPDGGLSLETAEHAFKGGDSGAVIAKGNADDSLLVHYVTGDEPYMPKDAEPLSEAQTAILRRWIDAGASWPKDLRLAADASEQLRWWSLQPISHFEVPQTDSEWVRNPIDAFLLTKLREAGLEPSPEADRRTLLRRLSFDLHGLPPTPEQVDRFLADDRPQAYERLVDELLASPRYGERWGRHWLDVVHYGDTHGYDKDKRRDHAWPYRDYVIESFNADVPYSQFVREQLAGDVLFPDRPQARVATGFIVAGPWDFVGHVELREGTTDKKITRVLDRDDMVTNAMSTFASVTVHCARCHNHKFDPITQEDYYSLQAVFAGIERADQEYDRDPDVAHRRRQWSQEAESLAARIAELEKEMERSASPKLRELDRRIAALTKAVQQGETRLGSPLENGTLGYHSQIAASADVVKWVQVDLGKATPITQVVLVPAHVKYKHHPGPGFGFPVRFRVEASGDPSFKTARTIASFEAEDFPNPKDAPVVLAGDGKAARYVRVTAGRLWERTEDWVFALSELVVLSGTENAAAGAVVESLDSIEAGGSWGRKHLVDGIANRWSLVSTPSPSPANGYHSHIEATPDHEKWVQVDLGASTPLDAIRLIPARPTDFPDTPGFGFPVRFRVEISDDPEFANSTALLDAADADYSNPGAEPVEVPANGATARFVRVTATRLWERRNDFCMALAELQATAQGANVALGAEVTAKDSIEAGRWSTANLCDGFDSRTRVSAPLEMLIAKAAGDQRLAALESERAATAQASVDPALRQSLDDLAVQRRRVSEQLQQLPPPAKVYSAANRFAKQGNFTPAPNGVREVFLLVRGDVEASVKEMAPGAISGLTSLNRHFDGLESAAEGERRAALAAWLTDPDNPLTWRSIVNRVWHYHFGRGIVDTPNDFGRMGSTPTHPELLDWLAAQFRDGGQSLKQLHRLIVCSAAYRQVSQQRPDADAVDGENRLLWRMNRRRLDAESVRDALLAVAGSLDLKMGGPGYDLFEFKDDHSPHYRYDKHDVDDPATLRRTVYRFVVRSVPDPLMECLDCADPSAQTPVRNETITALQALSLMNNPLLIRQSQRFADRASAGASTLKEQIDAAYRLAFGRLPETDERDAALKYTQKHGLANLCRLLLNSNEFLFVD